MYDLSIVIPVINEAARIGKLLPYLFENSDGLQLEIIVVDGGSQDSTVEIARNAGATVLHSTVCSRAAQMNLGARAARSAWLYFVHADTLPPKTYVQDIREATRLGYVMGCFRYRFDSSSVLLRFNAWFVRFQWLWCQGGDKTFFISKDLFWSQGGYDEYYTVMEEYDFLRRTMPQHKLYIIPKNALVSARKYEKNSWLRVQWANFRAFTMFRRGVAPNEIKKFYTNYLR